MQRAIAIASLLVLPTVELSAQRGSRSQESDSTESTVVQGVAAVGSFGFSLLRLALHRNDNGPARQFCYGSCASSRPAAALQLSDGPNGLRLGHGDGPEGNNRPDRVDAGSNASSGNVDKPKSNNRGPRAEEVESDELFDYVDVPGNAKGLKSVVPNTPAGDDPPAPWSQGPATGCALHACSPTLPLPQLPDVVDQEAWMDSNNKVAPGYWSSSNPSGAWASQEYPVIVNPEPGTWAMLAVGLGGLVMVRRRRQ